jgi:hypothetical protein
MNKHMNLCCLSPKKRLWSNSSAYHVTRLIAGDYNGHMRLGTLDMSVTFWLLDIFPTGVYLLYFRNVTFNGEVGTSSRFVE